MSSEYLDRKLDCDERMTETEKILEELRQGTCWALLELGSQHYCLFSCRRFLIHAIILDADKCW